MTADMSLVKTESGDKIIRHSNSCSSEDKGSEKKDLFGAAVETAALLNKEIVAAQ